LEYLPEESSMDCIAIWVPPTCAAMVHENRIGFDVDAAFYEGSIHQDPSAIDGIVDKIVSIYGSYD
jgi:hypothetical protein